LPAARRQRLRQTREPGQTRSTGNIAYTISGHACGFPHRRRPRLSAAPTILVFDSGLGGLSVFSALVVARPDARYVYVADDAVFPYGALAPQALIDRVMLVMARMLPEYAPDLVVIACNTASTLVLEPLRARFTMPFVGTVPAIKPAAALSKTGVFSVLATPGTVRRDYTHDLIIRFAAESRVTLVGAPRLAALAEAHLRGEPVDDADLLAEIQPAFVDHDGKHTDTVVLACTHYPLLRERLEQIAPWPVMWIDPAPAIARRVVQLIGEPAADYGPQRHHALFTSAGPVPEALGRMLRGRGFDAVTVAALGPA